MQHPWHVQQCGDCLGSGGYWAEGNKGEKLWTAVTAVTVNNKI